jgi:hypothetical protein
MIRVNLEELGSGERRDQELSILADRQIFNPRFVGKLGNEAGRECRIFLCTRDGETVRAHRSEECDAGKNEGAHGGNSMGTVRLQMSSMRFFKYW